MTKKKFQIDFSWNFLSLGILAISGILINFVILSFYSVDALGIFNQTYAIFVIASQFSVLGIHFSVLKRASKKHKDIARHSKILISGIMSVLIIAVPVSFLMHLAAPNISNFFDSSLMTKTVRIIAPSLILFSLNKVFLSYLNGLEKMKMFAMGNIIRYLTIIFSITFFSIFNYPIQDLLFSFLIAESVLTIFCILCLRNYLLSISFKNIVENCKSHILFGFKAIFSGIFVELNYRIDVIVLGFFASDSVVGIYSLFSLAAEGTYNIFVLIKNLINPKISRLLSSGSFVEFQNLFYKFARYTYLFAILVVPFIGLIFYGLISFLPDAAQLNENFGIAIILLSFILLISGFIPFEMSLTLSGKPGSQSFQAFLVALINLILNLILVPIYGAIGAAISTGMALAFGIIYIYYVLLFKLGIRFSFIFYRS